MSNLMLLHTVAKGLDYLLPGVVFVGGPVTEKYATDTADTDVRPTNEIHFISYGSHQKIIIITQLYFC